MNREKALKVKEAIERTFDTSPLEVGLVAASNGDTEDYDCVIRIGNVEADRIVKIEAEGGQSVVDWIR